MDCLSVFQMQPNKNSCPRRALLHKTLRQEGRFCPRSHLPSEYCNCKNFHRNSRSSCSCKHQGKQDAKSLAEHVPSLTKICGGGLSDITISNQHNPPLPTHQLHPNTSGLVQLLSFQALIVSNSTASFHNSNSYGNEFALYLY